MSRERTLASLLAVAALVAAGGLLALDADGPSDDTAVDRGPASGAGDASGEPTVDPAPDPALPAPASTPSPQNPELVGRLPAGDAVAADVRGLVTVVPPGRDRSPRGAVEAFAADSSWVLGSEAARRNPVDAVRVISTELGPTDVQMLTAVPREGLEFRAVDGAYRVLGRSGPEAAPDQVMLEIAAPLRAAGRERWMIAGGVIAWVDGRWQLSSLQPREIPQPSVDTDSASEMTPDDIAVVLDGLGWATFANSAERVDPR